jgi:hypothetical protein
MRRRERFWSRVVVVHVSLCVACACVLLPPVVQAQSPPSAGAGSTATEIDERQKLAHTASRLYFGMWTTHLKHDVVALDNNWAIGVTYRGFFGATFLNSFGRRAFTGGIQRTIFSTASRPLGASLGYRLGFVTGYDGRFMRLARKTPVLPIAQPFGSIDVGRVGFEVSYTFVVMSVAASYRF